MPTTRALGPGAGLSWLRRAVQLGRRNARAVFGAVALLALVALVPNLLQVALQTAFRTGPSESLLIAGAMTVLTLLLVPPMVGGVLRVIDAAERGEATHATAAFEGYKAEHGAGRMAALGLLMGVFNLVFFLLVMRLFGSDVATWFDQVQAASLKLQDASLEEDRIAFLALVQAPPPGFRSLLVVCTFFGMFMSGVSAIAFGQIALADARLLPALRDGIVGTLKNALPILLMAAIVFALTIPFLLVFSAVVLLLGALGSLAGDAFAALLMLPVYLATMLMLYVVMLGVMYSMWQDVCGAPDGSKRDPGLIAV